MKYLNIGISQELVDVGALEETKKNVCAAIDRFFTEYESMPDMVELLTGFGVVGTK